jgi:peptidyl-prolyl cis-trans isomerase D
MSARDSIINMPVGAVVGPYLDASNYVIAKKIETRLLPDSVKCRHILIGTVDPRTGQVLRTDSAAKKTADSIFAAIRSGADFGLLAASISDDQGSKNNRGEYNFSSVDMGTLAKEFSDYIFYKPTGSRDVVKTQFGYHVMEVLNQKNFEEAYKVAYLSKKIVASEETDNTASAAATQFAGNSRNAKDFEANVLKSSLNKRLVDNIREMDYSVDGMPSRALVKWIYDNKVGAVSEPFDMKDKYIVVQVTGAYDEGVQPAAIARTMVEPILRSRKKAAEIKKKTGNASSLEAIASTHGTQVMNADTVRFADPFVANLGSEPRVIGAAFNKGLQGKISGPIDGQLGVFYIRVNQQGALPSVSLDINQMRQGQLAQLRQYANYSTLEALRKAADIKDTRRAAGY